MAQQRFRRAMVAGMAESRAGASEVLRRASKVAILQNVSSWKFEADSDRVHPVLLHPRLSGVCDWSRGGERGGNRSVHRRARTRLSRAWPARHSRISQSRGISRTTQVDSCIIGPAQNNHAAIRAYEKAGFKYLKTVSIPGELEPEYLMRIGREDCMTRHAMSDSPEYSAIILAGGQSSRMGRPKADLPFEGGTMLDLHRRRR